MPSATCTVRGFSTARCARRNGTSSGSSARTAPRPRGIAYQQIHGSDGAVKAETCDECGTYTKVLYLEKDHRLEPFADDLASYALDVLVEEAGWRRATPNPFLMPIAER